MTNLISTLIDLGALAKDSIVTARRCITNKFGINSYSAEDYVLQYIDTDSRTVLLREANGSMEIKIVAEDITAIDGMSLLRYAEIYNVNPDGSAKSIGRKRGRKPKIKIS